MASEWVRVGCGTSRLMGAHLPRRGRVLGPPATLVMDCQMATGSRSASRSRNSSGCHDELIHPNAGLPTTFLSAFGAHDHETMAKFCADDETLGDPLFTELDANGVRAMWRMFCTSDNNIEVSFNHVQADDASGSARWETICVFPKARTTVHNKIGVSFSFRDGLNVRHRDHFDFYRWSRMALGPARALPSR